MKPIKQSILIIMMVLGFLLGIPLSFLVFDRVHKEDRPRVIIHIIESDDLSYTVFVNEDKYEYLNKSQLNKLLIKYQVDSLDDDTFVRW